MFLPTMHSMNVALLLQVDQQDLNSTIIPQNNDSAMVTTFSLVTLLSEMSIFRKLIYLTSCVPSRLWLESQKWKHGRRAT